MQQKLASTHRASRHALVVDRRALLRHRISAFLDSLPFTVVAVILTVIILFMDDFRLWLFPKSADVAFCLLTLTILCLFCVEILLSSLTKDDYFLRFFFYLDVLAALSLIPDIPLIWDPILGLHSQTLSPDDVTDIAQAAHASSSASPANRVIKFVRLIRLVRIAKLFELCAKTKKTQMAGQAGAPAGGLGGAGGMRKGHSQVGQHLSEQTTRKVVLLVLLMLFGIPLLQPQDSQQGEEYSLRELSLLSTSPSLTPSVWQDELNFTLSYYSTILYLNVSAGNAFDFTFVDPSLSDYRVSEILSVSSGDVMAFFSRRAESRIRGEYNIITTLVVLVLLAVGAVLFNRNNHRMVIVPIERMMATIVALQQNPLAKASLASAQPSSITTANKGGDRGGDEQKTATTTAALTSEEMTNNLLSSSPALPRHNSTLQPEQPNETGMLERTLEKLTGLLQVGFGEAGSKMIQKCMNLNAEGDLDPLVDGTKMLAIFGFCDIRRFTDATECLKEDVMMYVNEIAAIVHSQVAACDGNPNKNIGDAFLLVWRLPQEMEAEDIAELQKMVGVGAGGGGVGSGGNAAEPQSRASPSHSTPLPPAEWATPKGPTQRTRAHTVDDRDRADSDQPHSAVTTSPTAPVKSLSFIASRQAKPSILRHLTGSGFPFSSPSHSSTPGTTLDLHKALHLPPRHLTPALRASVSSLADKALVSFIRVIVEINASEELKKYALNTRIQQVFDDFQVELGFGLHVGWAIEGPIGSRYKIDASYLSPHVNLAETLEGTTKLYGVPLLLSGEMFALLSPFVRAFCRRLDCVKVSGRETPIVLYTFDMQQKGMDAVCRGEQLLPLASITRPPAPSPLLLEEKAAPPFLLAADEPSTSAASTSSTATIPTPKPSLSTSSSPAPPLSISSSPLLSPSSHPSSLRLQFHTNPPSPLLPYHLVRTSPLSVLHQHIPVEFFDYHAAGVDAYLAGHWDVAAAHLTRAQQIVGGADEPTRVVLTYMAEHNGVAPDTWQGYREL